MTTLFFWSTKAHKKDLFPFVSRHLLTLTLPWLWAVRHRSCSFWVLCKSCSSCRLLMARWTQKAPAVRCRQQALWSRFNVVPCSVSHAAPGVTSDGITSAFPWSVEICSSTLSSGHYCLSLHHGIDLKSSSFCLVSYSSETLYVMF